MELIEREDLSRILARGSASAASHLRGTGLPLAEAVTIAKQIADALEAAHQLGIVHRDLKPASVLTRTAEEGRRCLRAAAHPAHRSRAARAAACPRSIGR